MEILGLFSKGNKISNQFLVKLLFMKFKRFYLFPLSFILVSVFIVCKSDIHFESGNKVEPRTIIIQPIGKFDKVLLNKTKLEVQKHFSNVLVLPQIEFSSKSYSKIRGRRMAGTVIAELSSLAGTKEIYVGITEADICMGKNAIPDFGIIGLGYKPKPNFPPGKSCICSTKRLHDKSMFYKIVLHELGHNYGLDHCTNSACYMHAAERRDRTSIITDFCSSCKPYLIGRGWKF